jgi:2-polyprenyl-3-methyl-5-hydroxy-6-metoxy-1,4-benzoquinol methylase
MSINFFDKKYFETYVNNKLREASYFKEMSLIEKYLIGGSVLDFGCGYGNMMKILDLKGWEVFGADVSKTAIDYCKKSGQKVSLIQNGKIKYRKNFDLIIMRGVYQHLISPIETLNYLNELNSKNGYIAILATPNINSKLFRRTGGLPQLTQEVVYNLPSDTSIVHALSRTGYKVVDIEYPYWNSGYQKPIIDILKFVLAGYKNIDLPAFPRNVCNIIARKEISVR